VPDLPGDSESPDSATDLIAGLAPELVTKRAHKQGVLPHGADIPPHRHAKGQLPYPAAGVLATTTERGT
jgi:hypothetical protein